MVASKDYESASVPALETEEQFETLDRVLASVHLVTKKQLVCLWKITPNVEQFNQVVELAVHVPTDYHGYVHRLNIFFFI